MSLLLKLPPRIPIKLAKLVKDVNISAAAEILGIHAVDEVELRFHIRVLFEHKLHLIKHEIMFVNKMIDEITDSPLNGI